MSEENKMNINEIMKNWKIYTNTDTVKDWYEINDNGSGYDTDMMVCEFCEHYNYDNNVYHFLDNSY